jgi:subtilisin family serine protease
MVRSRLLARLVPAAAILAMGAPNVVAHTSAATTATAAAAAPQAIARPATLAVPHDMLRAAAVPVIVELNAPAPTAGQTLLNQSPQLRQLLGEARVHLLDALHADGARNVYPFHLIPAVSATVAGDKLASLLTQPGVRAITLDQQHTLPPLPDDFSRGAQGGAPVTPGGGVTPTVTVPQTVEPESYTLTRADFAHDAGINGAGVRVAVIDSGLDTSNPDLAGILATDANGKPLYSDWTGTGLQDTVGHGTACTSMIAAQGRQLYKEDNRTLLQVYPVPSQRPTVYQSSFHFYGMAPAVKVMEAKIFDERAPHGGGFDSWIVRAIEWAVDHHADVISESFGGLSLPSTGVDPTAEADKAAVAAGVTVVAADGNEGPGQSTVSSPANAPGVIAVGASTDFRAFGQNGFLATFGRTTADNIAAFTSRGPTTDGRPRPDIAAPGAFGWALFPQHKSSDGPTTAPYNVGLFGGTSAATPVVAGSAALVVEAYEHAHAGARPAPATVRSILMSSAHDLGFPAMDQGAGRVDAWQAVRTALRSGPSFLLTPNALAISGTVSTPFQDAVTISNTGTTTQRYALDATVSQQSGVRQWPGVAKGKALNSYTFNVGPGIEHIVGTVYWNSADRFTLPGGVSKDIAMRVALYDPLGRFTNYSYGVGTGYAAIQITHPMAGAWTLVVSQNGSKYKAGVRRYSATEPFEARLYSYVSQPYGTLTPSSVTLAPGQSSRVTLSGLTPAQPGAQGLTVHVRGDHTAVIPVALTSYITLQGSNAAFGGALTGASTSYFSLSNENKVYSLNVPVGTRALNVALSWPDTGYGVILLLFDPSGEIVDAQFNGIRSSAGISSGSDEPPYDLSAHSLQALWSDPAPGKWQVVVLDAIFAGEQRAEPFSGHVTLNDAPVTPTSIAQTVLPGGSFDLALDVHNNSGPNVAEGYFGYATTDRYGVVPLGVIRGPFEPVGGAITGSSVYTYTTGFVPPDTRLVVSSFAARDPNVPIDLSFADPIGFARAQGQAAPVTIDGHTYQGVSASVAGPALPIGQWNGEITLRRPIDAGTHGGLVGVSYAYARTPLSWVVFDHGLDNGRLTGGQPLILLPGQRDQLHANVAVPLSTPPGVYHANLSVYTVFGDKAATVPLTIVVQTHTGSEPANVKP